MRNSESFLVRSLFLFFSWVVCVGLGKKVSSLIRENAFDFQEIPILGNEIYSLNLDAKIRLNAPIFKTNSTYANVTNHLELLANNTFPSDSGRIGNYISIAFFEEPESKTINYTALITDKNILQVFKTIDETGEMQMTAQANLSAFIGAKKYNFTDLFCNKIQMIMGFQRVPWLIVDCPNVPSLSDYKNTLFLWKYNLSSDQIENGLYYFNYSSWAKEFNPERGMEIFRTRNNSYFLLQFEIAKESNQTNGAIAVFSLDSIIYSPIIDLPFCGWLNQSFFSSITGKNFNLTISDLKTTDEYLVIADSNQGVFIINDLSFFNKVPKGTFYLMDFKGISRVEIQADSSLHDNEFYFLSILGYSEAIKEIIELRYYTQNNSEIVWEQYNMVENWTIKSFSGNNYFLNIWYKEPKVVQIYCRLLSTLITEICGFINVQKMIGDADFELVFQKTNHKLHLMYHQTVLTFSLANDSLVNIRRSNGGIHPFEESVKIQMNVSYLGPHKSIDVFSDTSFEIPVLFTSDGGFKNIYGERSSWNSSNLAMFNQSMRFPIIDQLYGLFLRYDYVLNLSELAVRNIISTQNEMRLFDQDLNNILPENLLFLAASFYKTNDSWDDNYFSLLGSSLFLGEYRAHFFNCRFQDVASYIVCGSQFDYKSKGGRFSNVLSLINFYVCQEEDKMEKLLLFDKETGEQALTINFTTLEKCTKLFLMPFIVDDAIMICMQPAAKKVSLFSEYRFKKGITVPLIEITKTTLGLVSFSPKTMVLNQVYPNLIIIGTLDSVIVADIQKVLEIVQAGGKVSQMGQFNNVQIIPLEQDFNLNFIHSSGHDMILAGENYSIKFSILNKKMYEFIGDTKSISDQINLKCSQYHSYFSGLYTGLCTTDIGKEMLEKNQEEGHPNFLSASKEFPKSQSSDKELFLVSFYSSKPILKYFFKIQKFEASKTKSNDFFMSFTHQGRYLSVVVNKAITLYNWYADEQFIIQANGDERSSKNIKIILGQPSFTTKGQEIIKNHYKTLMLNQSITIINNWELIGSTQNWNNFSNETLNHIYEKNEPGTVVVLRPREAFSGGILDYKLNLPNELDYKIVEMIRPLKNESNNTVTEHGTENDKSFILKAYSFDPVLGEFMCIYDNGEDTTLIEFYNSSMGFLNRTEIKETPLNCTNIVGSRITSVILMCTTIDYRQYIYILHQQKIYNYKALTESYFFESMFVTLYNELIIINQNGQNAVIGFVSMKFNDTSMKAFLSFTDIVSQTELKISSGLHIVSGDFFADLESKITYIAFLTASEDIFVLNRTNDTYGIVLSIPKNQLFTVPISSSKLTKIQIIDKNTLLVFSPDYFSFLVSFNSSTDFKIQTKISSLSQREFDLSSGIIDSTRSHFLALMSKEQVNYVYLVLYSCFSDHDQFYNETLPIDSSAFRFDLQNSFTPLLQITNESQAFLLMKGTNGELFYYQYKLQDKFGFELKDKLWGSTLSIQVSNLNFKNTVYFQVSQIDFNFYMLCYLGIVGSGLAVSVVIYFVCTLRIKKEQDKRKKELRFNRRTRALWG